MWRFKATLMLSKSGFVILLTFEICFLFIFYYRCQIQVLLIWKFLLGFQQQEVTEKEALGIIGKR